MLRPPLGDVSRPWHLVEAVERPSGRIELRRRGERDFLITLDGRVLMNSAAHHSERVLGELAVEGLAKRAAPRVLIAGLGMGFTLRGALDGLPPSARVRVVELEAAVQRWCRGPLRELTEGAALDARVRIEIADVRAAVARAAGAPTEQRYHAIALDLFEGPRRRQRGEHPLFGPDGLSGLRDALTAGGALAVWSEAREPFFEKQMLRTGFRIRYHRPGRAGLRHAVYVARLPESSSPRKPRPSR